MQIIDQLISAETATRSWNPVIKDNQPVLQVKEFPYSALTAEHGGSAGRQSHESEADKQTQEQYRDPRNAKSAHAEEELWRPPLTCESYIHTSIVSAGGRAQKFSNALTVKNTTSIEKTAVAGAPSRSENHEVDDTGYDFDAGTSCCNHERRLCGRARGLQEMLVIRWHKHANEED